MKCWDETMAPLLTMCCGTYLAMFEEAITGFCLLALGRIPCKSTDGWWLFFFSMLKAQPSSGR